MSVILYQKDSKDRLRIWKIEVQDKGDHSLLVAHSGLMEGKQKEDVSIVKVGKNIGRSNETTHYTQAVADMQSKVDLKIKRGFATDPEDATGKGQLGSGVMEPMTAKKHDETKKQSGSKTLEEFGILDTHGYIQRKKDGIRRFTRLDANSALMHTRAGALRRTLPHLEEQLCTIYDKIGSKLYDQYGIDHLWVDGEAFTNKIPFTDVNGICKKEKTLTPERAAMRDLIDLHVYDVALPIGFEHRLDVVNLFDYEQIHAEETFKVIFTPETVQKYIEQFVEEGEEGAMLRVPGIPYEHKRSASLIKCKLFEDSEFTLIGFEESKRGSMVGAAICEPDGVWHDRDGKLITELKATPIMSHVELAQMWEHREKLVGRQVTINYMGRSQYGVPRHPRMKAFRYDLKK